MVFLLFEREMPFRLLALMLFTKEFFTPSLFFLALLFLAFFFILLMVLWFYPKGKPYRTKMKQL